MKRRTKAFRNGVIRLLALEDRTTPSTIPQLDFLTDFVAFRNAFALGGTDAVFDFDNSGTVDFLTDFVAFRNRYGLSP